jgi:hypothetical protein
VVGAGEPRHLRIAPDDVPAVNLVAALAAWLLWGGSKAGALIAVALLPVEAVFWVGFALPIPWLLGVARVVLIALAWRSLS